MKRLSTVYLAAFTVAFVDCSNHPTEEEIQADFAEFVAKSDDCSDKSDCTIVYPGCPLGCYVAVRADKADAVEKRAQQLIDDWESGVKSCEYDCTLPPEVTCSDAVCSLVYPD